MPTDQAAPQATLTGISAPSEAFAMENLLIAEHWRAMAENMRAKAETMRDNEAKKSMLKIAAGYDKMAKRIDALAPRGKDC